MGNSTRDLPVVYASWVNERGLAFIASAFVARLLDVDRVQRDLKASLAPVSSRECSSNLANRTTTGQVPIEALRCQHHSSLA